MYPTNKTYMALLKPSFTYLPILGNTIYYQIVWSNKNKYYLLLEYYTMQEMLYINLIFKKENIRWHSLTPGSHRYIHDHN